MRINNADSLLCNLQMVTGAGVSGLSVVSTHENSTVDPARVLWAAEVLQVRPPSSVEVGSRFVTRLHMRIDNANSLLCNLQTVTGAGVSGLSAVSMHEHSTEDPCPRVMCSRVTPSSTSFISGSEFQVRDEDR